MLAETLLVAAAFVFTHFAGSNGGGGHADGVGSEARFLSMDSVAAGANGTLYVADTGNHTIRRIGPGGVVTTIAGAPYQPGSGDGTGSAARFHHPHGIAVDGAGNLYVADSWNHTIRKVTPAGVVSTLAGRAGVAGHVDGADARFNYPFGIAVDRHGNVYVADEQNDAIRRITPRGIVTTIARDAKFSEPRGVAVDRAGNLYVADTNNHAIHTITRSGVVSTLAGAIGTPGHVDATGSAARFHLPLGIHVDRAGNVYVGDTRNHVIRRIAPDRKVTTVAKGLRYPIGVTTDAEGTLFVADYHNHCIRRITRSGAVSIVAGMPAESGRVDGKGSGARFAAPSALAIASDGSVYVADTANHRIRRITRAAEVTTLPVAVEEPHGIASDGTSLYVTERGKPNIRRITPAGEATILATNFREPHGIAADRQGNVYVAEMSDCTIRKIGNARPIAKACGSGLAVDARGNLYVAGAQGLSRVAPTGEVTTLARFERAWGVAVDGEGNVYVTDRGKHTLHRIAPDGAVTTIGGLAGTFASDDGEGTSAHFDHPTGIAVDADGNLYIADANNHAIRLGRSLVVTGGAIH